ncbi:hypothetical protein [Paenibacillus periandrae]|uniref:hypothetical protein n=1 Tax=Paenibacillus periandrae TaxID=1761741 RepID=UPI001F093A19|nr:hypothetical protein [Paenibacillus periandrae]
MSPGNGGVAASEIKQATSNPEVRAARANRPTTLPAILQPKITILGDKPFFVITSAAAEAKVLPQSDTDISGYKRLNTG